jgi:predicted RNA-binding protein with PIN domain
MIKQEENKKTYSEDHVVTILEELKGQFKVFGEGQKALTEKVDGIDTRVNILADGQQLLIDRVSVLEKDMKEQFMAFGEGQQVITDTLDRMEGEIKIINEKLDNKAEKFMADDHEKRIFKLEKKSLAV